MTLVWYILIHVSLGLIGRDVFTFTNLGALYCALAGAVVQGYAIWEIHRIAWPRFVRGIGRADAAARRGYWNRLGRMFIFRVSAFSILSLLIASIARGAGG